jgi:FlaG/FlaF family flagellin (archaellin)
MVAITVILAAVIGTFVLGLGDQVESAPQASFNFEETSNGLEIRHRGGDNVNANNFEIRVNGEEVDSGNIDSSSFFDPNGGSQFTAGKTIRITGGFSGGDSVDLVYIGGSGNDRQDIIGSYTTTEDFSP